METGCELSNDSDAAYNEDTEDEAVEDPPLGGEEEEENSGGNQEDAAGVMEGEIVVKIEPEDPDDDNTDVEYYERSYQGPPKPPAWQSRSKKKKPARRRSRRKENNLCPVCHHNFSLFRELQQHLTSGTCRSADTDTFICAFCAGSFNDLPTFKDHYLGHLERSIFSCIACCTNFTSKRSLDRHMMVDASVLNQLRARANAVTLPSLLCTTVVNILAESANIKRKRAHAFGQDDDDEEEKETGGQVLRVNALRAEGQGIAQKRARKEEEETEGESSQVWDMEQEDGEEKEEEGSDGGQETTSRLVRPFVSSSLTDAPMTPSPLHIDDSATSHSQNSSEDPPEASLGAARAVSGSRRKLKKPVQVKCGAPSVMTVTEGERQQTVLLKKEEEPELLLPDHSPIVLTSLTCPMCGDLISDTQRLSQHLAEHEKLFPFFCTLCDANFMEDCLLEAHVTACHHSIFSSSSSSSAGLNRALECKLCGMYFKRPEALMEHVHSCRQAPSCVVCGETFSSGPRLQEHYYGHSMEERASAEFLSCSTCGEVFVSATQLRQHMKTHGTAQPYTCEECGDTFRQKRMLERHQQVHYKPQDCRCQLCGVQLLTRSGYLAHLRGHKNNEGLESGEAERLLVMLKETTRLKKAKSGEWTSLTRINKARLSSPSKKTKDVDIFKNKTHACPFCDLTFNSTNRFQDHVRGEHKKQAHFDECEVCHRQFYGKEYLQRHLEAHSKETASLETFPCDQCSKVFRRKFALETHKKVHTFKTFIPCDICGEEFRFINEVEKHKYKAHKYDRCQKRFECHLCRVKFATLSHLNVHCRHTHSPGDGKPFKCSECLSLFASCTELKQHIFGSHESGPCSRQPIKQEPPDNYEDDKSHPLYNQVETIVKDLVSKLPNEEPDAGEEGVGNTEEEGERGGEMIGVEAYNRLTRQKMSHPTMAKRFVCETCYKCFATKSDLRTHIRTHTGETPYKCDYCERAFKQRGHRKLHIQVTHTKDMPYTCEICHQGYPTRYRYLIHLKRHSGVKEHKCPYCNRAYYTVGKLNEHKRKNHAEEIAAEIADKVASSVDSSA